MVKRKSNYKKNIEKLKQQTIKKVVGFEAGYARHLRFMKKSGLKPMAKEAFRKDFMFHSASKVKAVEMLIAKFSDPKAPIISKECLETRRLLVIRQNYLNTQDFAAELDGKSWGLFYGHLNKCDSCSFWQMLHRDDAPTLKEFHEASQSEFEHGVDDFFTVMKGGKDTFEEAEEKQGLKAIPSELMKHLSSEYAKQDRE